MKTLLIFYDTNNHNPCGSNGIFITNLKTVNGAIKNIRWKFKNLLENDIEYFIVRKTDNLLDCDITLKDNDKKYYLKDYIKEELK